MATVIGSNKEEHDRKFMEQRGQIPKSNNDPSIAGLKAAFDEAIAHHNGRISESNERSSFSSRAGFRFEH